jgi:lipoprotein-anchoring transpeptidase ErfK/SrfK
MILSLSVSVLAIDTAVLTAAPPANSDLEQAIATQIITLKQSQQNWIEVDLSEQKLIAWWGKQPLLMTSVSTGKAATPTYPGVYTIQRKYPQDRMRGNGYDIPDVPYVQYFDRGYAIHGAYWHNNFGTPVSHGCINLPVDQAQWLFNQMAIGTPLVIHE